MTATARVALTDAMLPRGWFLDVLISAAWTPVSGIQAFRPTMDDTYKDGTTFDGAGWQSDTKTAKKHGAELTILRAPQSATPASYDVGAEYIRTQSLLMGAAGVFQARYYEVNGDTLAGTQTIAGIKYPITEAWSGYFTATWDEKNDANDDLRAITVKLMGRGPRTALTFHPASA